MNRAKTKRWVEAKSYSYDGDDWGEYDENDEYGVRGKTPPPPVSKPTGFRQKGQGIAAGAEGSRSATNPEVDRPEAVNRPRSFDNGDERRAFSAGTGPPPEAAFPAAPVDRPYQPVQPVAGASYGDPTMRGQVSRTPQEFYTPPTSTTPLHVRTDVAPSADPASGSRQPSGSSWTQSVGSDATDSTVHFQNRRDFSPSAVPQPLHTNISPIVQRSAGSPASGFPARKSSLSQGTSPLSRGPVAPESTPAETSDRARSSSNASKPMAFVRPADIYKRLEEERSKERKSQDSERRSFESVSRPTRDTSDKPGQRRAATSNSPDPGARRSASLERVEDGRQQDSALKSSLTPVAERKSEYGFPGFSMDGQDQATPTGTVPQQSAANASAVPSNIGPADTAGVAGPESPPGSFLPKVSRFSGFGTDFLDTTASSDHPSGVKDQASGVSDESKSVPRAQQDPPRLPHQPSLGFRTVVNQAFERTDDRSVPDTPLSAEASGVSRSNTDSTSGISPIMSRVPSAATAAARLKAAEAATPAIAEESNDASYPRGQPVSAPRQYQPAANDPSTPRSHSRNPSAEAEHLSDSTPRRSPVVERVVNAPEAAVGQLDTATPTSGSAAGQLSGVLPRYEQDQGQASEAPILKPLASSSGENSSSQAAPASSTPRSDSPTKSRVRDLAGKFNEIADSRRNSAQSVGSRNSSSSPTKAKGDVAGDRPSSKQGGISGPQTPTDGQRSHSQEASTESDFRPKLPGQWESFATTQGSLTPPASDINERLPFAPSAAKVPEEETPADADSDVDFTPTKRKPQPGSDKPSLTTDPLAAVAAAGSAVAEAIKNSVGLNQGTGDDKSPRHDDDDSRRPKGRDHGDIYARPLGPERMESSITNTSSFPPTPPPKEGPFLPGDGQTPGQVQPLMPSKGKATARAAEEDDDDQSARRPPMLPHMSTQSSLDELESDRLRREIVKTLSPLSKSENADSDFRNNRESGVLPREYERYWAGGDDNDDNDDDDDDTKPPPKAVHKHPLTLPAITEPAGDARVNDEARQAPAASSETKNDAPRTVVDAKPALLDHRFSWEQPAAKPEELVPPVGLMPNISTDASAQEEISPATTTTLSDIPSFSVTNPAPATPSSQNEEKQVVEGSQGPSELNVDKSHKSTKSGATALSDAYTMDGLQVVEAEPVTLRQYSSAEVAHPPDLSQFPPPPQHPAVVQQHAAAAHQEAASQPARLQPFREIMAMKSPQERIHAFNLTRDQFANMSTGLSSWVAAVSTAHPELLTSGPITLASTVPAAPGKYKTSPAGRRLSRQLSGFALQTPQTSQPQRNIETPPDVSVPSTSASSKPAHSSSPSGTASGRLSTHQMQAKGKDLLQSASVLGGKATTVGKGLFAKGRSKLKGSGGGSDKVDN